MPTLFGRGKRADGENPADDVNGQPPAASGDGGGPPRSGRSRSRRSSSGRGRATAAASDDGATGVEEKPAAPAEAAPTPAAPRRRRASARGNRGGAKAAAEKPEPAEPKAQPKRASRTPAPAPEPSDLGALVARQSALIERQNALLTGITEAQEKQVELLERVVGLVAGPNAPDRGGPALEVKPRLAIFVDVPNILYAAERSGVTLDWGKVSRFLSRGRTLVRAIAYSPVSDDPATRRENERFVVPFIEHGFRIVTKPLKRFTGGGVKANFDVELAIDILTMADRMDVIALVSGDGDFRRLVEIVGSRGVRVEVVAFGQSTSTELREVSDRYVDMAAYVPEFSKD